MRGIRGSRLELFCRSRFLRHSKWLKHISMLDVFIMGIIVVTAAGSAYSQQGRDCSVMLDYLPLLIERLMTEQNTDAF